jgi:hypothetical protein
MRQQLRGVGTMILISVLGISVQAANPGPPDVTSLFVPIEGDVIEPGTTNTVHLTGEVHIVTQARFDADTNQWAVSMFANLVRVRGTSASTGVTYLGVGAVNVSWVGTDPGPPDDVQVDFGLLSLAHPPNPIVPPSPNLPVYFRDFTFAQEAGQRGTLLAVTASFN